jgi:hypothetical protein
MQAVNDDLRRALLFANDQANAAVIKSASVRSHACQASRSSSPLKRAARHLIACGLIAVGLANMTVTEERLVAKSLVSKSLRTCSVAKIRLIKLM